MKLILMSLCLSLCITGCVTPTDTYVVQALNGRLSDIEKSHQELIRVYDALGKSPDNADNLMRNISHLRAPRSTISNGTLSEKQKEFIILMMENLK